MRDYMQDLPNLLDKIKIDMNKTFDIYKSLEEFNYRFTNEQMNKRWRVFGGPRDVMTVMQERKSKLD